MADLTGLGSIADLVNTAISKIWPDKTEQEKQQLAAAVMVVQGQIDINKEEAKNPSLFVSGWRPSVGWVCSAGLAVQFLILPIAQWSLILMGKNVTLPSLDLEVLITMLGGMLGLGGLRTAEKIRGVAAK
jgi:hypothetical protein